MELTQLFQRVGEEGFRQLMSTVSISRLKTYQLYGNLKARTGLPKLNVQLLRRAIPSLWERLLGGDEELAGDLAQAILVSNLDMIIEVLDFLGVPHHDGFFEKDLDASQILQGDWQQRAFEHFRGRYPEPLLIFYLNHLARELTNAEQLFLPGEGEK